MNKKYENETIELLKRALSISRNSVKELCDMYDTAKVDWNSHSRQEITDQLTKVVPLLLSLEDLFAEQST